MGEIAKTHQRIIGRMPSAGNRSQLAKEVIRGFGRRAFRRPLDGDELKRLFRLYQLAERDGAKFEQAIKLPLQAILVSPNFLYRVEIDRSEQPSDGPRELGPYEIASRLSYFLWSSMPDDALFNAAVFPGLTADRMPEQVKRMLDDRKSTASIENFAGQWLQLRKLNITTRRGRIPQFSAELREDIRHETELFFEAVLREDRPITDLIDADFTVVNEGLAKLYGMKDVQGSEFRRVSVGEKLAEGC